MDWKIGVVVFSFGVITLFFMLLGQGFDPSGFSPHTVEKFLYKHNRVKLIMSKSTIQAHGASGLEQVVIETGCKGDCGKSLESKAPSRGQDIYSDTDGVETEIKEQNPRGKNKRIKDEEKGHHNKKFEEKCNVHPAKGVIKGHGPCITQFPHQPASRGGMDDCWRMAFAVAQWKQPRNPLKAEYGDDWEATAKAYPHTAKQAQQIVNDFNEFTELPVTQEWSPEHPYVRLCVPTKCGLSKKSGCNLRKTDFLMHLNPGSKDIDNTTHLFYKGFVRDGHLMLPNAGLTAH